MEKRKIMLSIMIMLAAAILLYPFVSAVQPTQQYSKIFLSPFYRASMDSGTNYAYTLTVNPPDGVSGVLSAIVTFNIQINGQTQNLTLRVNGQACNNADYSIATAFSTTGNTQAYFDCSNVINKEGNYNITLRSAVNTGTVQGWLDLTYMNNPVGEVEISGTEYIPNEPATIFVQLKDSQGAAVPNGICYLDVWYPANTTLVHPYVIRDAPMLNAIGDDGIYYYDLTTPSILGVYMLSAKCSYAYDVLWIYHENDFINSPLLEPVIGTWSGSTIALNSPQDSLYTHCIHSTNICKANFTYNTTVYDGPITNTTLMNLYFIGQASKTGMTVSFSYFNGTAFVALPNSKLLSGEVNAPNGMDDFQSNIVPLSAIQNNTKVIIQVTSTGGAHDLYINWLALSLLTSEGGIQDVKGSSEMHVTANYSEMLHKDIISVNDTLKEVNATLFERIQFSIQLAIANNQSLYNFVSYVNQSIYSKLNSVESDIRGDISASNASITSELYKIESNITNLSNFISSMNISIFNDFNDVKSRLDRNYNKIIDVFTQLNLTNVSIMNKLYSIQGELAAIYNISSQINYSVTNMTTDFTSVLSVISDLNNTVNAGIANIRGDIFASNASITNELYNVRSDINNLYSLTLQVNGTTTTIRTRIEEINASITEYLYGIKNNLTDILNEIQSVYNLVFDVNTSIQGRLDTISIKIDNLGTQIDNVNASLSNQINNLMAELAADLANITNVNLNITADLGNVANDVWTLFFRRGTPPLAPSTDYYCDANNSNILNKNITYEFIDNKGNVDYFSKVEQINCGFGCIEGGFLEAHAICDYDPTTKGIAALIIIAIIGVALYFIIKHTGGEE